MVFMCHCENMEIPFLADCPNETDLLPSVTIEGDHKDSLATRVSVTQKVSLDSNRTAFAASIDREFTGTGEVN